MLSFTRKSASHGPAGAELDRENLWAYFVNRQAAFDDFTATRQAMVSEGAGYVACRGRFVRPFTGAFEGWPEPNGRTIEYRPINIVRYAPDGRLVEEWVRYDVAAFLARLRRPR